MPGKIKVKVLAGRNLPVMDRAGDTTDAYVEIKFGGVTHKTDVCKKSLNPHWNSTEWYRFEVDESELQDEPLQLRLMDHDTYSANDAIGKVVISLAPLLAREPAQATQGATGAHPGALMSGWIPVFDTLHGIRGELNVIVKVELFSDFNKYKTSSCGVQFFHCPMIPPGYRATTIHGFVEELVVNDDPEYQWIDKIRTPRASNEARQVAFVKLSNEVQRLVGLKAAELGANAVVGYQQDFDLEGEAGVVARAIGTAVSIVPLPTPSHVANAPPCSQQQLNKYLDILATDNSSTVDLNQYFQTHQEELEKLLTILHPKRSSNFLDGPENFDDEDKNMTMTRQSSIKSYTDSVSIYQDDYVSQQSFKHITEDQTELNKLLYQDNELYASSTPGPFTRFRKFRRGFLSKKLPGKKSKKIDENDDKLSIKSNSSDASKLSLSDIRNEFKKLKRLKKPKFKTFKNDDDEGIGMASILARSVINAHTSLACIAEAQDSEQSPSSTMRRKTSESEPTISISDDDKSDRKSASNNNLDSSSSDTRNKVPDILFSSLTNVNIEEEGVPVVHRKLSESCPNTPMAGRSGNLLKLPGEIGYFGSASSATSADSSEMYSSSDEDDESFDMKTDTGRPIETTSFVVQSVLEQRADPTVVAPTERKPNELDSTTPEVTTDRNEMIQKVLSQSRLLTDDNDEKPHFKANIEVIIDKPVVVAMHRKTSMPESSIPKITTPTHHIKFHNPFAHKKASKSISAPCSPIDGKHNFVYRQSKKIKSQISKISHSNMIRSISHYSLLPKKKCDPKPFTKHSSSSDIPNKGHSHETVLGSPFLSYNDLFSLDKDSEIKTANKLDEPMSKVHMYIGSEPASRASISGPASARVSDVKFEDTQHLHAQKWHKKDKSAIKPTGLLHTAMETILIDKVHSLMIPTSPDPKQDVKDKKFFDDVHEKLMKYEESEQNAENVKKLEETGLSTAPDSQTNQGTFDTKPCDNSQKPELHRKLTRQNSVHSSNDDLMDPNAKVSSTGETNIAAPCKLHSNKCTPVLKHFHPILSGSHSKAPHLETIPSLPETSVDCECSLTQSLDSAETAVEIDERPVKIECSHTNAKLLGGSVCVNSHAACRASVRRERDKDKGSPRHLRHESYSSRDPPQPNTSLNATSTPVGMHRRSSDSDLSVTPKGGSQTASVGIAGTSGGGGAILRPSMNSNNLEMLEYPFLTMTEYPPGFIVHLGGTVCARSVKIIDGGGESVSRASWWAELRTELRSHARALRCPAVIAYSESTAICEDVCVMSVSGTAAVINLDCDFGADTDAAVLAPPSSADDQVQEQPADECSTLHLPYSTTSGPYRPECGACLVCKRAKVPSVMLATCSRPRTLLAHAKAVTVTATAARVRRAPPQAEPGARDISDQLPFLEYELHRLLLGKLRMQGANALFNIRTQLSLGERCVAAVLTGSAVRVAALPQPAAPKIKASEGDKDAAEIQKALLDTFIANRASNGFDVGFSERATSSALPEVVNEDRPPLDLCSDKDAFVLEMDETEDVETARALAARRQPIQVFTNSETPIPRAPPLAFAQVCRARLLLGGTVGGSAGGASGAGERHVARTLDAVMYKLRTLRPFALTAPRFQLDLPEDEIQLVVSGAAIPLVDSSKPLLTEEFYGQAQAVPIPSTSSQGTGDADDAIFAFDEDQGTSPRLASDVTDEKSGSEQCPTTVALTSLARLAGARQQRFVCALQLLFVRETTSVRELGGFSGFLHTFMVEVLAVVRAHTAALGGNALTSFYITQLMLQDNAHKNQGQCLLSVGGDVVNITY